MSKLYHEARKQARAEHLQKQFGENYEVIYTDATKSNENCVIVAVQQMPPTAETVAASIKTTCKVTVEVVVIALAIRNEEA